MRYTATEFLFPIKIDIPTATTDIATTRYKTSLSLNTIIQYPISIVSATLVNIGLKIRGKNENMAHTSHTESIPKNLR